jgi:hypothetical protein
LAAVYDRTKDIKMSQNTKRKSIALAIDVKKNSLAHVIKCNTHRLICSEYIDGP